jgi:hypothetical protein
MPTNKPKPFTHLHPNILERFWQYFQVGLPDACWEWDGTRTHYGHGLIRVINREVGDCTWLAHRIAFYVHYGIDPYPDCVCHTCDNPPCVNPAHLFQGTHADNNRDRHSKGRSIMPTNRARGYGNHPRAKLTDQMVRDIREWYRVSGLSCQTIAASYQVHKNTIVCVVNGTSYCHVKSHGSAKT